MKNAILLLALISPAFAGQQGKPCNIDATSTGSKGGLTAKDFITPLDFKTIGGNPSVSKAANRKAVRDYIDKTVIKNKASYTLFNPTPDSQLRELSPDRPDATDSPLTVDAGRFALEASLFDYRRDAGIEDYTYGSLNFKAGLTHNMDLQTVFDLYSGEEKLSDVTFRLKYNVWGNDGGDSAVAIMPFIKVPTGVTNSNDKWEGGVIIPWATDLSDGVGLGLMAEIDYLYDGAKHRFEFLHTAVVGYDVAPKTGAYLEYIGIWKEDTYDAYAAGGMNYTVNDNLILDFGIQTGLNSDAADFGFFTGFTKCF